MADPLSLNVGKSHPVFGNMNWTPADCEPPYAGSLVVIDSAIAETTSPEQDLQCRGLKLKLITEVAGATCDIDLIQVTSDGDVVVKTWTGVKAGTQLWATRLEHIDLQGDKFKVKVSNISSGFVTVEATVIR